MTRRAPAVRLLACSTLSALAACLAARTSHAEPEAAEATLAYERAVGAETCPDEAAFRGGVARRLGYDPFRSEAPRTVRVTLDRAASGFTGHIEIGGVEGAVASRDLSTEGGCDELVDSVLLAVSLAIDPLAFADQGPPPPAKPPLAPEPSAPRMAVSPPATPWIFSLSATGRVATGLVPGVSLGPLVGVGARRKDFELFVDGGVDLPLGSVTTQGAESGVQATLLHAGLGACAHVSWVTLRGQFDAGSLNGSTTSTHESMGAFYADVALSAALEVPLGHGFRATVGAQGLLPLETIELRAGPPVWKSPAVAGAVLAGLVYRL